MKLANDFSDSFTYNHLLNELSLSIKTQLLLQESVNEV